MESTSPNLHDALINFSQSYLEQYRDKLGHFPVVEADEQWASPCELSKFNDDLVHWQPIKITEQLSFNNVENALEIKLHPSIKAYFSTIYSESIPATCEHGHLQLLFAWSKDDFDRLQQNLIGHILMKQKLKQDVTLFFAVTDQDDHVVTLDNATGEVWVEKVGRKPHKKLANTLEEFILQLSPDIYVEK
ncbi:SecY-interacting protein [Thalassotalea marina]|uniref:Protein Syd n=1 Tax=Thalassotalea marina TaxID=1673741 RepID=A0A919BKM0_9GAMM|nr:SecY-interacting protein [Thalassotalea marina]GHF95414.1 protein Syd [Thalassotalea marina]